MKSKIEIPAPFHEHFAAYYGKRWEDLLVSLRVDPVQICRWNKFSVCNPQEILGSAVELPEIRGCYSTENLAKEIVRDNSNLLTYYVMDPASVVAAQMLNVRPDDCVLDLCAAPGGKSLVLAEALNGTGELIANELSLPRRERLKKVIQQYIPREKRDGIWVTGYDGARWASTQRERFDRILVDAPCSGERHLLESAKDLAEWSVSRIKQLAQRQYALLAGALLALKSNGEMVYSTCSISPEENDQVIAKLLKKKSDLFSVVPLPLVGNAERTEYGLQFLPDLAGWGPIYICKIRKT